MTPQSNPVFISSLKSFPRACALTVIAVGGLVLAGWAFDIVALKSVLPGLATMKANTALGFILAGVSLWLLCEEKVDQRRRRIAQACAFMVALIGALTLSQDLFGWDLGVDQLLFQDPQTTAETSKPGRTAPATALNFLMLGSALLLLDVETRRDHCPAEWLILVPLLSSTIALIGYTYGVQALYRVPLYSSMAFHSALAFLVASLGLLWARPKRGLMAIISSDSVAGLTARRLLPAAFFIPLVLGWLRLMGQRAGLYETEFGLTLMVALSVVALAFVIWRTAELLGQTEARRRRAEQSLTDSERRYRTLAEAAHDGIFVIDRGGYLRYANAFAATQLGRPAEEIIGKHQDDLLPSPTADQRSRNLEEVFRTCQPMRFREEVKPQDRAVWLSTLLAPIKDELGICNAILGVSRDITEQKQAEDEIRLYQAITQAVSEASDFHAALEATLRMVCEATGWTYGEVWIPKADGTGLQCAPEWYGGTEGLEKFREGSKGFTFSPGVGLPGRVWLSKKPLWVRDVTVNSNFLRGSIAREAGLRSAMGIPILAANEVIAVMNFFVRAERAEDERPVNIVSSIAAQLGLVFQRKLAQDQAHRNLERIQALRDIDVAITSTLDLQTVLDVLLEKTELSFPYSTITGIRLLSKESGMLEPVACRNVDKEEWMADVRMLESAGRAGAPLGRLIMTTKSPLTISNILSDPRAQHLRFMRKCGAVSYAGVPLVVKDQVLGILIVFTKEEHEFSSEEIEFLSALASQAAIAIHNAQLYEDLVRSNKVKGEFLSVMSHELRTPLNVVMGYAGIVRDGMLGELNPRQEEALSKILGRAKDQLAMVDNILHATVLETQKINVEMQPVVLGDFINQLKTSYETVLDKPLELKWDCSSPAVVLHTDGPKLKHVLQNLVDNAVKFTEKGTVTVSARIRQQDEQLLTPLASRLTPGDASRLSPQASNQWVEFTVADTGIGIPKEHLPFMFERFRQVDSSETRLYGGVGLGLYIVRKFTELLGGKLEVESELGKGSTFRVIIPCEC